MKICRNCGREVHPDFASLHSCDSSLKPIFDDYCDSCGDLKMICLCGITECLESKKKESRNK